MSTPQVVRMYHTYILKCADGSLYTGWTNDLDNRLNAHNLGKGAKYTRARLPVVLVASWDFDSQTEAMSWEYRVKQMTKPMKLELIAERKNQKNH